MRRLLLALLCLLPCTYCLPDITEEQAKAQYTYNFLKFTKWPESQTIITLCLFNDDGVTKKLQLTQKLTARNRAIQVTHVTTGNSLSQCSAIYFASTTAENLKKQLLNIKHLPILTVSSTENFIQNGGMIELFNRSRRVKFSINAHATTQANVILDAKLIELADEIIK